MEPWTAQGMKTALFVSASIYSQQFVSITPNYSVKSLIHAVNHHTALQGSSSLQNWEPNLQTECYTVHAELNRNTAGVVLCYRNPVRR